MAGASGTDWSLQNAAQYAVADGVTAGTTTITSATAAFGTDVVGNLVYVSGGTGSVAANWYQVTVRNSATSITVDRTTGLTAGTGVTLNIGGALGSPGQAAALLTVTGMRAWVKYSASAYNASTATAGAAGPISLGSTFGVAIEGYDVTRGDRTGNRPTLKWTASAPGSLAYICVLIGNTKQVVENLACDGNSVANVGGFNVGVRSHVSDCVAQNCNQSGAIGYTFASSGVAVARCLASSCTTGFSMSAAGLAIDCTATGCTTGFTAGVGGCTVDCLAYANTTGFTIGNGANAVRCTADGNTTGFSAAQSGLLSCLATNQSGVSGVGIAVVTNQTTLYGCALYNNLSSVTGTPLVNEGQITLAADPYVNQAGADFRPNNNNPGGAQLRGTGIGVYGQTDNQDIGAVQHADSGGTTYIFQVES